MKYWMSTLLAVLTIASLALGSCNTGENTRTTGQSLKPTLTQYLQKYTVFGAEGSYAYAVACDDSGNAYVAGYTGYAPASGEGNFSLAGYGAAGNELWKAVYADPQDSGSAACALALDDARNIYVSGWVHRTDSGYDYVTIRYDSDGNQQWAARYNGAANGDDKAAAIVIGTTGIYVTGSSAGDDGNMDFLTLKYDFSGKLLWQARYNSAENGDDIARSITIDASDNIYITGSGNAIPGDEGGSSYLPAPSRPGKSKGYYATVKYDSDGNQLWTARYAGTGDRDDLARVVKTDAVATYM
jgi:hypothetical protein